MTAFSRHPCQNPDCQRLSHHSGFVDRAEWSAGIRLCGPCRRAELAQQRRRAAEAAIQQAMGRAV